MCRWRSLVFWKTKQNKKTTCHNCYSVLMKTNRLYQFCEGYGLVKWHKNVRQPILRSRAADATSCTENDHAQQEWEREREKESKTEREREGGKEQRDPERVNVRPLTVRSCELEWLTYRVSWCNVRVKLGQSLWAGGALAKRLPLLQKTDRQWEEKQQQNVSGPVQWHHTCTSSATASVCLKRHWRAHHSISQFHCVFKMMPLCWKQQLASPTFLPNSKAAPHQGMRAEQGWVSRNTLVSILVTRTGPSWYWHPYWSNISQ